MALPRKESEANLVCQNIAAKLGDYQTTLGLSAGDVSRAVNNATVFQYLLNVAPQFEAAKRQFSTYKDEILNGEPNAPTPDTPEYTVPQMANTTIVSSGIIKWTNNLIERIKRADGYTSDIGKDLGIADDSKPGGGIGEHGADFEQTLKTTLKGMALANDTVQIAFNKQGLPAVRIQMRRGAAQEWINVGDAFTSPLIDAAPSIGGNPERREYRAVYLKDNQPFGQWSDIITVYTTP